MITLREAISLTLDIYNKKPQKLPLDDYLEHVTEVGACASVLAAACGLDVMKAGVLGYCHDIGKIISNEKQEKTFHGLSGYEYFKSKGEEELAQVCLSHSFSSKNFEINEYISYGKDNIEKTKSILDKMELTDYDRIIELSDLLVCIGYVNLKDRMRYIEYTYSIDHKHIRKKYKNAIKLKRYLEAKYGINIYKLLGIK